MKNILKLVSIALGLAMMPLTTLCYGQANREGPPHIVIYWNADTTNLQTLASSAYTDIMVNFLTVDSSCQFNAKPRVSPGDLQALHDAGKTVLVSFGGSNVKSAAYKACAGNVPGLVDQIANFVTSNGFDGVDIDFEDSGALKGAAGYDGVQFLIDLTNGLYSKLPQEHNIITHAPQTAYWFDSYKQAYVRIWQQTNNHIAWFNNQTYNNCLNKGNMDCHAADKIQNYNFIAGHVPATKLVMGVPVSYCGTTDLSGKNCTGDGFIPLESKDGDNMTSLIHQLQQTYPNHFGGIMGWNYLLDMRDNSGQWGWGVYQELIENANIWMAYDAQTGLCLDGDYNGHLSTKPCNAAGNRGSTQGWVFRRNAIVNVKTGQCLDSSDKGAAYTMPCNGGNYQNWQFFGDTIRDRRTERCLESDINGTVTTQTCSGANSQNWLPRE